MDGRLHDTDRGLARIALAREAIRLELERRKSGELRDPSAERDGVKIIAERTDDSLVLTAPASGDPADDDNKPLRITLRTK